MHISNDSIVTCHFALCIKMQRKAHPPSNLKKTYRKQDN